MKKIILFLLVSFFILSCSRGDDDTTKIDDTNPIEQDGDNSGDSGQKLTLNLNGVTLNYSGLQTVTSDGESNLEENQNIDIPTEQEGLGLPILFTKNDELLFGYYPKEENSEITNEDVLFFFFASFPSFDLLDIGRDFLKTQLLGSSLKSNIIDEMVKSMNQEEDPFENASFRELFLRITNEIITENSTSKSSKTKLGTSEFKIDYTRDGEISWPNDVPLFATVGVEIFELETNQMVSQDFLSPIELGVVGQIVDFVYNLPNDINNVNESNLSKQLQADGEYLVRFSNGNPFHYNDTDATDTNWRLLFSHTLSVVLTAEILKWGNSNDECKASLFNLVNGILYDNYKRLYVGIDLSNDDAIKTFYKGFLNESAEEIKGAIGVCSGATILGFSIKAVLKKLDLILDTSNLILATRDFLISDIYEDQKLYYQDDFLVGEISEELISPIDFSLNTGEAFSFEANYLETIYSYEFNRNGISSIVMSTIEDKPAAFLPFRYEIVEGDVTSDNPTSHTGNSDGNFILDFVMGSENSIIDITPEFLSPNVQSKTLLANICDTKECQEEKFREWLLSREFNLLTIDNEAYCTVTQTTHNNGETPITTTSNNCPGTGDIFSITFNEDGTWDSPLLLDNAISQPTVTSSVQESNYSLDGQNILITAFISFDEVNVNGNTTFTATSTYEYTWTGTWDLNSESLILDIIEKTTSVSSANTILPDGSTSSSGGTVTRTWLYKMEMY